MIKTTVNTKTHIPSEGLVLSIPRWSNRFLVFFVAFTLLGCAPIKVTTSPIDTPLPSAAVFGIKPVYCLQLGAGNFDYKLNRKVLVKLSSGESCWYIVQSEAEYNPTGLQFGEYEIAVPAGQFMFDASRQVNVPEGDDGTWLTRLLNYAKRNPEIQWFALVKTTCGNAKSDQSSDANNTRLTMPKEAELSSEEGELCIYVNDVLGHYKNNSGRVLINIKKL
jgi:hypothetical protein